MRREMVTEEELQAARRRQGITDITTVRSACLEADGEISVVREQGVQGGEP
ncbi:YetF domain-containing protein [Sorangium sp. So ce176]|uniref:YetF domain-containing protein n=1 Tax=Sorangium sp. So ce176 TaxID=3133286 RepID=UPI003F639A2A